MINDEPKEDGYNIVKFTYEPYHFQEDIIIHWIIIAMGEHISNACCLNLFR